MPRNWLVVTSVIVVLSLLLGTAALAGSETHPVVRLVLNQDEGTDETTPTPTDEVPVDPTDEPPPDATEGIPTDTPVPPVTTGDHPVISAIATFFNVPYSEIEALHESGLGMGVIASIYLMADALDKTPEEVLGLQDSGEEWHSILQDLKDEMKGGKLGSIMSGRRIRVTDEPQPGETPTADQEQEREKDKEKDKDGNRSGPDDSGDDTGDAPKGNEGGRGDQGGGNDGDEGNQGGSGGGDNKGGGGKSK